MRAVIQITGILLLSFLMYVLFSEWRFYSGTLPTILVIVCMLSLLSEILYGRKNNNLSLTYTVLLSVIAGLMLLISPLLGIIFSYKPFFSYRPTIYMNDRYAIEKSKGYYEIFGGQKTDYYLLEFKYDHLLV